MTDGRPLSIMMLGDTSPGNGGECYANAFRRLGHIVDHQSEWVGLEHYLRGYTWRVYRHLTTKVWESHRRHYAQEIINRVKQIRPDVFIALGGLHLAADDIRAIRSLGAWVVNISHDDFLSRYRLNKSQVQWDAIPAYDQILTTRDVNVHELKPRNPNIEFFMFAYEPRVHHPVPIPDAERDQWCVDVAFVGSHAPQRTMMMEKLVQAVPANYAIRGSGWHHLAANSPLKPYLRSGNVHLDDLSKAIGGASISLGFLRRENRDDYTQRTFEIPACGGLMLMERTDRQTAMYRDGEECVFFEADDANDLIAKVRGLLADPLRREAIRKAGMAALKRMKHSYDDRVARVIELFQAAKS